MAELRDQVSQYIGFEPNEIRLPITEEDRWLFSKIIADQEGMADIVMGDYHFLQRYGHNGKGGKFIHIGWLLACTVAQAKKVNKSAQAPSRKRFIRKGISSYPKKIRKVPLAPVLIR